MKGITYCGACAGYDKKKHRCTAGACEEGDPRNPFYDDCPLSDVVEVVRCKDCKWYHSEEGSDELWCYWVVQKLQALH